VPSTTSTSTTLPAGVSGVLRIRCLPDDHVEVLTPVVAAQMDGLHVEALDPPPDGEVGLRSVAISGESWWSGSSGIEDEFKRPVPEGEGSVWCIRGPYQVESPWQDAFTVVDPFDWVVPYVLGCAKDEQRYLEVDLPLVPADSVEEAIRRDVSGVLVTDTVEQAGYVPGDAEWPWLVGRVVRSGRVVAAIQVDGRDGWKYRAMSGSYCADSGIGAFADSASER
jgi:hypothetical protein